MPSTDDKLASGQIESASVPGKYFTAVGNIDGTDLVSNDDILMDDTTTAGVTYIGYAVAGSSTADAVWKIFALIENSTPPFIKRHADGTASRIKVWDNRTTYTY